jgi:hypothetical protein
MLHIHWYTYKQRYLSSENISSYINYRVCRCGKIQIKLNISDKWQDKSTEDKWLWDHSKDVPKHHLQTRLKEVKNEMFHRV